MDQLEYFFSDYSYQYQKKAFADHHVTVRSTKAFWLFYTVMQ